MLDHEPDTNDHSTTDTGPTSDGDATAPGAAAPTSPPRRRRAATRKAGPPAASADTPPTPPAEAADGSDGPIATMTAETPAGGGASTSSGEPPSTEPSSTEPSSTEGPSSTEEPAAPAKKSTRKRATKSAEGATRTPRKRASKKAVAEPVAAETGGLAAEPEVGVPSESLPADTSAPATDAAESSTVHPITAGPDTAEVEPSAEPVTDDEAVVDPDAALDEIRVALAAELPPTALTEEQPADHAPAAASEDADESAESRATGSDGGSTEAEPRDSSESEAEDSESEAEAEDTDADDNEAGDNEAGDNAAEDNDEDADGAPRRRRRRRGGRRRRRGGGSDGDETARGDQQRGTDSSAHVDAAQADAAQVDSAQTDSSQADSTQAGATPAEDESAARRSGAGRRRGNGQDADESGATGADAGHDDESADDKGDDGADDSGQRRRRRRRRRRGEETAPAADDPVDVVVRVREPRSRQRAAQEVTGIEGSTRMEAKRQRRREGREAGRRRAPILSEAEFLARRESVARKMIIRQREELTQIAVLEDDILVEHYVDRESAASLIGNVYLGRVQNVLPSMEAAFIDIGRGRNAVLYAGEVDWDAFGANGQQRKVENVLKSGQTVLVQVTKDPVGAKGARLTSHITLPGRYIVYAPGGHLSGISRKLPDTERKRLKAVLNDLVPESASVIVRTAAEGASEDELVRDVNRLKAQWEDIERKVKQGSAPKLLYGEPDLTVRIVRDLFTEDFAELIIQGNGSPTDAYEAVDAYVGHVAPHLHDRMRRWDLEAEGDLFATYRLDEQIAKALERKVFLPSGGSLIIDRTEAMTVIDVNTGKFTGSGGNLEATVTSNNLEAAEEIVRQLRLRDIGGIIVIDFIDMVLPSNRELLLRRLVECLGRDRTRHQVAEVTSLGLVQMTRKKIGTGLLEAFTSECEHCHGRGYEIYDVPVETQKQPDGGSRDQRGGGRGRGRGNQGGGNQGGGNSNGGSKPQHPVPAPPLHRPAPQAEDDAGSEPGSDPVATPEPVEVPTEPTSGTDSATDTPPHVDGDQSGDQSGQPEPAEPEPAPAS